MIIGHTKNRERLAALLAQDAVPQALLFAGPAHVGKRALADVFARAMIAGATSMEASADASAPNFYGDLVQCVPETVTKKDVVTKKEIGVAQIRTAVHDLSLSPYHGHKKVLVIDDADMLTRGAQNALLKTLEEPTPHAHIIVVAHDMLRLLPTLRSRCALLAFGLVADADLQDASLPEDIVRYSAGRPGVAYALQAHPERLETLRSEMQHLSAIGDLPVHERFALADRYAKNLTETFTFFDVWIAALRAQAHEQNRYAAYAVIAQIMQTVRTLRATRSNARLALENLFLSL